jgi:hypothetical protein
LADATDGIAGNGGHSPDREYCDPGQILRQTFSVDQHSLNFRMAGELTANARATSGLMPCYYSSDALGGQTRFRKPPKLYVTGGFVGAEMSRWSTAFRRFVRQLAG